MDNSDTPTSTVGIIGLGCVGLPLAPGALVVLESTTWPGTTRETLAATECVVISTAHSKIDLAAVVEHADPVVDLRSAVRHRLGGCVTGAVPSNVDVL